MISNEITIKIKTLNTTTFPINIYKKAKISELKSEIFKKVRIHKDNQKLIFQGRVLDNDKYITDYNIEQYDVIHLVETDSREYQAPPSNTNTNSNTSLNEYERMINSIFPPLDSILNFNFRSNNQSNQNNSNNNNQNNNNIINNDNNQINQNVINNSGNNSNDMEGIFDSFKYLLKYKTYNFTKAGEVITQNYDNLYNMYNNLIDLNLDNTKSIKKLYSSNYNTNFKVGQWVDIKDRYDTWIEGQITAINNNRIKVQYMGMPPNMNEWLEKKSERIALFRTYTSQKNLKNFYSLYPNKSNEYNREQIHAQENIPIYYTGIKKFEPLNNHLILFLDLFKEKIRGMLKVKEKLDRGVGHFESKEDFLDNERFYFLGCMQIFPLLDRFGRIMIDLANYLMYNSYKYFEDNIFNFRKNVYDESLRFMNIYDRRETVNKNRLKHFQTLVQFSCAKIEKDENIENVNNNNINNNSTNNNIINNNNDNNNARRPYYGIIITRPRELTRDDYINRSRRYMVARTNISYMGKKPKMKESKNEYSQTEIIIKKFNLIKEDKNVVNIFFKAKEKIKEKKIVEKENIHLDNNNNININNNIINEPKNNSVININITSNNNIIGKNNNKLLRSSQYNFNNKNLIKKEKIQIDAKKKEDIENEIKIENNNNKNLFGLKIRKSVDRYSHMNNNNNNNNTKVKRTGYRLKSKGKIFNKK